MTAHVADTAKTLAEQITSTHDLSLCPILADALEESGYTDQTDLRELRARHTFGRDPYTRPVGRILMRVLGITVRVVYSTDGRSPRRRTRRVSLDQAASDCAFGAIVQGRAWVVRDGGSVPNSYGYAALTDGVLVAARYDAATRTVYVTERAGELPANKVTHAGVAGLFGFRDLCDGRVSFERRYDAKAALFADLDRHVADGVTCHAH